MSGDEREADYYRRRAEREAAVAAAAEDGRVRALHQELAGLYTARAKIHADRAANAAGSAA